MQPLCLSFDNGPDPEMTPLVLGILARRRIPAMFFVFCWCAAGLLVFAARRAT